MSPVVDIIGDVITAMKPDWSDTSPSVSGQVVTFTDSSPSTHLIFAGQKVKVKDGSGDSLWHYGTVTTITDAYTFTCTFTDLTDSSVGVPEVVLNYHYGHPLEIVNVFAEVTKHATYKREMFPAICLFHDFPEKFAADGYQRTATVRMVIVTDTKPTYKAADRYTYTFEPILYPLYDLLIERLEASAELGGDFPHTKYDRLYWGKEGIYGSTANIFQDYIDAIELENLELKILKSC